MKPFVKAYENKMQHKMKEQELYSYWNGIYVLRAITAGFGKGKFPDKPIEFIKEEVIERELTEDEKEEARKVLIEKLKFMQSSFESSKNSKECE